MYEHSEKSQSHVHEEVFSRKKNHLKQFQVVDFKVVEYWTLLQIVKTISNYFTLVSLPMQVARVQIQFHAIKNSDFQAKEK